jgi:hypothetical protein
MFYGQCWKCGERWNLGTASTCTCEPEPACWQGEDGCPNRQACCDAQHCLYTTPPAAQPAKQWVGLTNEENLICLGFNKVLGLQYQEAKLREKNT